ncbi:MAG: TIGR01212 family radical SAM protein [Hominenteromicrobium sp.]
MNPFPYAFDNKRYHTLAYHNRQANCKTQKAVLDAGLSCPNLDGTCGVGGCIFCDGGSGYFTPDSRLSIREQLEEETARIRRKHPDAGVIAYFQAHTNTYADVDTLRSLYEQALGADIAGLSIATRPDCIGEDVLALLKELREKKPLTVELGLQSSSDRTAERINRGYPYEAFAACFARLRGAGIRICVHIIDGLPGENEADMLETARALADLRPDAVKIHLLHVICGTKLAELYESGCYTPLTLEEYTDIVVRQLELLPPETVIERITGDGDKARLLAPLWSRDKIRVLGTIDQKMARRNTWQGRLYSQDDLHI